MPHPARVPAASSVPTAPPGRGLRGLRGLRALRVATGALALTCAAAGADPAPRRLSFAAAVALSLDQNPDLALARLGVSGANARTAEAEARRYPLLRVDVAGNLYAKAYDVAFGPSEFRLHDQATSITAVTVAQPLTGLAYLSELVGARRHEAAAEAGEYDRTRLDTAYRTAEAFLRVLEARAGAAVAHQLVDDIQAELDRALVLRRAETYTDIDVLRFRSAKAAADQAALRADGQAEATLAALTVQLGLHDGAAIDLDDDLPPSPPAPRQTLAEAQARALAARPELGAARARIASAHDARRAAYAGYVPDVRAVASWEHATGASTLQPADQEFLGLRLSWNAWDWGVTRQQVVEASHAEARAALSAAALEDQVRLEVRRRWLDARTAHDSLAAARTQLETSEEALRLTRVRFDNAVATTTDVLDAQTDVARARAAAALSRFDAYLALVALARAIGDLPRP